MKKNRHEVVDGAGRTTRKISLGGGSALNFKIKRHMYLEKINLGLQLTLVATFSYHICRKLWWYAFLSVSDVYLLLFTFYFFHMSRWTLDKGALTRAVEYCTVQYYAALYCNAVLLHCIVLYCTVTALHCTILYCTVLHYTVLYCPVLYYTVLYCTVLYCTVLCCTVLHCTALYRTKLYCTVLYYTVSLHINMITAQ